MTRRSSDESSFRQSTRLFRVEETNRSYKSEVLDSSHTVRSGTVQRHFLHPVVRFGHFPRRATSRIAVGAGASMILVLLMGASLASSLGSPVVRASPSPVTPQVSRALPLPHLVTNCSTEGTFAAAYDPANGYLYVVAQFDVVIVAPTCTIVKTITSIGLGQLNGIAYDPSTKDMVALDLAGFADVIHGTEWVKKVTLYAHGSNSFPYSDAWDPAVGAMLIANAGNGVDLLYLATVNGSTKAAVVLDAFDNGNDPTEILVADGYVFSAGNHVDVFNERTLRYLGSFYVGNIFSAIAWDPLNRTVVVGEVTGVAPHEVYFLNADSVATRTFTSHNLPVRNVLTAGVGGLAYSPYDHDLYISALGGQDVWILSPFGSLQHVYLRGGGGFVFGLAYDPADHDVYAATGGILFVLS